MYIFKSSFSNLNIFYLKYKINIFCLSILYIIINYEISYKSSAEVKSSETHWSNRKVFHRVNTKKKWFKGAKAALQVGSKQWEATGEEACSAAVENPGREEDRAVKVLPRIVADLQWGLPVPLKQALCQGWQSWRTGPPQEF